MNSTEKQIIDGLVNKDDRYILLVLRGVAVHQGCTTKYVKNPYVTSVENAVRKWFNPSDDRYKNIVDGFPDIYNSFYSLFAIYIVSIKPETLLAIKDLKNWLFITADNFIKKNRKSIDEHIGLYYEEELGEKVEITDRVDIEEPHSSSDWARAQINVYINQISNEYYRDLLFAIKLEDVDREVLAEEYDKSVDDINRDFKRAWDQLIGVALSDIKYRGKHLFKKFESDLPTNQAKLLNEFFFSGLNIKELALEKNVNHVVLKGEIVKAYNVLLKTAKRETKIDEKEERKDIKELRRLKKQKK